MSQASLTPPSHLSSTEAIRLLSQPFDLRGTTIRNRLAKSAMSEALGGPDGAPGPGLPVLYRRWAEGGLGLVITGNVMIDRRALGEPGNVVIEDDRHLDALRRWAQAGTAGGTQLWMQLNHPGKQSPRGLNRETVSPSAVPFPPQLASFFATPRELRADEIEDIVQRFARAARVAQQAGFSGVQIHGAHGYLVSQFLSPRHNIRTDEWGGTPDKRRRFVLAVLAAMRAQVGPDFPIGIKLNSADFQRGGFTEEESLDTVRALEAAGIDLIEISGGTYEAPAMTGIRQPVMKDSTRQREAYFLEFAEKARAAVKVPLMVTGGFRTPQGMAEALASGAVDFVGLARGLALEPDLGQRLLAGQPGRHTVRMLKTGIGAIDRMGLLEVSWYTRQLHRIAAGRPPVPDESPLKVFLITAWKMMRGKGPRKLRA
ncbi:MAG: NADH:flavin oxidoreductase/NADH oxidase family protein [Burkholderiales bacterium]|nr:NADH:flavin oxidoreductase/NADH oxidase family protein [Burkholderiales bacterium]